MLLMYIGSWWPDAEPQVQEEVESRAGHRENQKKEVATTTTTTPATTNLATLATNQERLRRKRGDSLFA